MHMRNVLVTGAGGFIGSHLAEALSSSGLSVRAFIHYNSQGTSGWLDDSQYRGAIDIVRGDVRDYDSVSEAVGGCDTVFHLAALIGIPYSYVSPSAYIQTNVIGTYNILQAARHHDVANLLITSTSETYGTAQYVPIDEKHPKVGQSPYSATKIAADQMAVSYFRSFGLPVKIVRPFNTYGPRQSTRAIIPTIITQLLAGFDQIKLGSLTPTRDFVYVKDTVRGFMAIANSDEAVGQEINIATRKEVTMGDLASRLVHMINPRAVIVEDEQRIRPRGSEVDRLLGASEKMFRMTGWHPEHGLDEGLVETVAWFRDRQKQSVHKHDAYGV